MPISNNMETLCSTRAVKVLKYFRRMPDSISRSSVEALEKLPSNVLATAYAQSNLDALTDDEQLKLWLSQNPIAVARATVQSPLFNGTLVFAQLSFAIPGVAPSGVSAADTQTAISYATLAVGPIQRYASQYGSNSVSVWPFAIPYTARLQSSSFDQSQFEGWIDDIAQFMRKQQVHDPCIVVMHDRTLLNSPTFTNERNSFHSYTDNGNPYCYSLVFGQNLNVADNNHTINGKPNEKVYAHTLSHEIAEMVVDPRGDDSNPEVCDACAGNCNANLFDLFDQNGVFIGGTSDTATASGFSFFINSVVRSDVTLDANFCVAQDGNVQTACLYAPPLAWNGPGTLTTVSQPRCIAGHFSSADQRHLVIVGTTTGKIHEVFWKSAQIGIEGEDDVPVMFAAGTIVSAGTIYNSDQQRHVVLVGTAAGKVREIFWKSDTVGIEGQDDLPVAFAANSIVGVAGLYDSTQQRHIAIVGTSAGKVHEIFWKADTVGVEGHDDLPVAFSPGSIVGVAALYDSDQQRYVVVVATSAGRLHEIHWKADTVGIEGHDDLPTALDPGSIVAISGCYDSNRKRYIIAVGLADGTVRQVYWKPSTVGVEANSVVAKLTANSIVGVSAFYSVSDNINHIVVAQSDGQLQEFWVAADV
jgi:hypothetical protein